jgi:hypothetical protein
MFAVLLQIYEFIVFSHFLEAGLFLDLKTKETIIRK